jgi:hypothetical protein
MRLFKKRDVAPSPLIEKGLTEDPDQDREQYLRSKVTDGETLVREVSRAETLEGTRIPTPRFIARDDTDTVWQDGVHSDRLQRGAVTSFPRDVVDAIRTGHICISCLEPQPVSFPEECSLCGYNMREFQGLAFATQFEGETNYGPSLTFQSIAEAKAMEEEKKAFAKKIASGASPMKGLSHGA